MNIFGILETEYSKHHYAPNRIYYVNKSCLSVEQSKVPHAIGMKDKKKQIGCLIAAQRGTTYYLITNDDFYHTYWTERLMKGASPGAKCVVCQK